MCKQVINSPSTSYYAGMWCIYIDAVAICKTPSLAAHTLLVWLYILPQIRLVNNITYIFGSPSFVPFRSSSACYCPAALLGVVSFKYNISHVLPPQAFPAANCLSLPFPLGTCKEMQRTMSHGEGTPRHNTARGGLITTAILANVTTHWQAARCKRCWNTNMFRVCFVAICS